ncbi:endonuclease/exonuclease/phosphatase family protein [Streptomyces sp. NPDC048411]|uniref:endonuclease/exonuclease/phosphatase family protein n=1 Tax=Streptomyces sp. NPDC048411 TaxID=3157206 RepID=UPI00345679C9
MASVVPAGGAENTSATYNVWHWNVAGNTMHAGSVTDGMVDNTVKSVLNRDADFVSLNEICFGQYKAVQAKLSAAGWPQDSGTFSRFAATRDPDPGICNGAETFGLALFSRQPLGDSQQYVLPWDGKKGTRKMLCAPLRDVALMRFCTVHITTSNAVTEGTPDNVRQLDAVRALLDGFDAAGETYIVAGDFNAQPNYGRMNAYYAPSADTPQNPGNTGNHRELDDADPAYCPGYGEPTVEVTGGTAPPCGTYPKIDEIFVRENRIAGAYSADALALSYSCEGGTPCSDHRALTGTVRLSIG